MINDDLWGVAIQVSRSWRSSHLISGWPKSSFFIDVRISHNSVMHGSLTVIGWMVSLIFVAENCARGSFKTWGMGLGSLLVGSVAR